MKKENRYKIEFLIVMCAFGILGPIIKAINLPSSAIACLRAWISSIALAIYFVLSKRHISKETFKKSIIPLIFCGIFMAGDWIGLFEAYRYTTVASATVAYYMEPIFFVIGCAIFLKEKITKKNYLCILVAFVGMAMVSGIVENGMPKLADLKGILLAMLGGLFYAGIVLLNKKYLTDVDPVFRTDIQLLVAGIITIPYVCLTEDVSSFSLDTKSVLLLLLLGIVLTAFTYIFYFSNIVRIPTQTAAIFSYGDPVVAVIVSVLFMHEPITIYGIIGAILVIGSAIVGELE